MSSLNATLASLNVLFRGDARGLTSTMDGIEQRAGRMSRVIDSAVGTATGFLVANVAMRGFAMATDFAGEALIGYNARMEQAQIGFTTLLGSAEKATDFIGDLKDFAAKTPFDFPGLQASANQMLAMGFAADEIIPTLTAVGDATAALGIGSEGVRRATYALGQMRAAGRVNAQDMMQLTAMGIPAWKMLADAMGKTVPEVRKLSEKGLIPAEKGIQAILDGIKNGNMGGMMAEQAKTFNGSIATIQDTLMDLVSSALTPLFAKIRDVTVAFSEWVQSDQAKVIGTVITGAVNALERGLAALWAVLSPVIDAVGPFVTDLFGMAEGLTQIGKSLGFDAMLKTAAEMMTNLSDKIWDFIDDLVPQLLAAFDDFVDELPGLLTQALEGILSFADTAVNTFMEMAGRMVESIAEHAPEFADSLGKFLQTGFDWLINTGVPMAAEAIGPLALKFIDWVFEMLPKLLDALDEIILTIINFIITNAPVLAGKLVEWAISFVSFIATEVVPRLLENLPTILRVILLFIGGAAAKVLGKMAEFGSGMVGQLMAYVLQLPGKIAGVLANVISKVASWAGTMLSKATQTGSSFVNNLINFVISLPGRLWSALLLGISKVNQFVSKIGQAALDAGAKFVGNIVKGLAGLPGALWNAITGAVRNILPITIGPLTIGRHALTLDAGPVHQTLATYAAGTGRTREGLAYLHDDEAVLPKHVADWFRRNGFPVGSPRAGTTTGGGLAMVNVTIGTFYGTEDNIDRLGESLMRAARRENLRIVNTGIEPGG